MVRVSAEQFCERMSTTCEHWDLKGDEQIHIFADGSIEIIHPSRLKIYPKYLPFVRTELKRVFYK